MTDRAPAAAPPDLVEHLLAIARRQPDAPVLSAPGRHPMSWAMLAQRIDAARAFLGSLGIVRGDVVAGAAVDRVAYAAALAVLPASCTFAALSPALNVDAYAELFARTKTKAVLVPPDDAHPVAQAARRLGLAEIALRPDPGGPAGAFDLALARATSSLDLRTPGPAWAYLCATSGSTGRPKIVPVAHRQMVVTADAVGKLLSLGPRDASAHLTPLHLGNGQRMAYLNAMLNGGSVHLLPEANTEAFFRAIEDGIVTYTSASFAILRECLQRHAAGRRIAGGRLRFLRVASGKLEPAELDRLESAFGVPVITGLALAETGVVLHQGLPPAPRVRGSLGVPIVAEIRVADERGHALPDGEVGEIQVCGAPVFDGYLDDPALNAAAFIDGWFRTGDLGRATQGEVHLAGRAKEVINRGGDKIAPLEIDAALHALPGVLDAAAFGVPHPRLGEEVVAAVVAKDPSSFDVDTAVVALRAVLGARRAPRRIWLVDSLPRNDAGKVLRRSMAAWVGFDPATHGDVADDGADDDAPSRFEAPLAAMWARVLDRDEVARDANFGALGGDRTTAERLLDEVDAVFGVRLSIDAMNARYATVAEMARSIEDARAAADSG